MKRLIVMAVVLLTGGGGYAFYAMHPAAKSCESLVSTVNRATHAANAWRPGDDLAPVSEKMRQVGADLSRMTGLHAPFDQDASKAAVIVSHMAASLDARDPVSLQANLADFNQLVVKTNADCKSASGGVDGK